LKNFSFNSTRYIRNVMDECQLFFYHYTFNSTRYIRNIAALTGVEVPVNLSTPHGTLGTSFFFAYGITREEPFNSTRYIRNLQRWGP